MADIIIYGRGKTGKSVEKMAKRLGFSTAYFDDDDVDNDVVFTKETLVVVSPGVAPNARGMLTAQKNGSKIIGELDFCFPYCKSPCVSVTGTNGKTTTCQMIYHILQSSGKPARLLGNGGVPFSSQVLDILPDEVTVLESSSFQLSNCEKFAPYISVVTNIAPDHLDYHGTLENYVRAKCNNFCHQNVDAYSVFNADDVGALNVSFQSPSYTFFYSVGNPNSNCYYADKILHLNCFDKTTNYVWEFPEKLPEHNLSNVLCAVLVCYLLGIPPEKSCNAIESYTYLPHRLQTIMQFNGVTFVDDSKATNVHATVSAIRCFQNTPLALILGGSDKRCEFDDIFLALKTNAKLVCAVGQTADKIIETSHKFGFSVKKCDDYKQAVEMCYTKLKNIGGVVLMSNACASFDSFNGYAERGEHFAKIVGELCREGKKS